MVQFGEAINDVLDEAGDDEVFTLWTALAVGTVFDDTFKRVWAGLSDEARAALESAGCVTFDED